MATEFLLVFSLFQFFSLTSTEPVHPIAKPGCPSKCGNLDIPYPFGIGSNCSIDEWAEVWCDTMSTPPKLFVYLDQRSSEKYEVIEFLPSEIRVKNQVVATTCPSENSTSTYKVGHPFTFSSRNKILVTGCNADVATSFTTEGGKNFPGSSCRSTCSSLANNTVDEQSCLGNNGCCQAVIPKGLTEITFEVQNASTLYRGGKKSVSNPVNHTFNPCFSSLMTDVDNYTLAESNLLGVFKNITMLFSFKVGNKSCSDAKKDSDSFICKDNSVCIDSVQQSLVPGYLCNCSAGYRGNPFLSSGCQDFDECEDSNMNDCKGICTNTAGSYNCSCAHDSYGDGRKNGTECTRRSEKIPVLQITLGLLFGLLLVVIGSFWLYTSIKNKGLFKLRRKFFQRNGGLQLMKQISSKKIFTAKELETATNNFDQHQILGQGGYGTIYKGLIPDLGIVAIKRSRLLDRSQIAEFINEVVILTQIDRRNIVKLLGCCLEAEAPLLVYEFVSNGTLSHHIHKKSENMTISWENRLRIAAEIAGALAYLHSATSIPIIHRDVKSANILLDDNLTAKVADFGASRLNPLDQTQITTLVKGTMGYLDPEYFNTSMLTEKSDVYSFGVVLAELLTGEMPISFERSQEERNLAKYFTVSMIENNLYQVLDAGIINDNNTEQVHSVAELTKRCLNEKGAARPTMKEVAAELEGLRGFGRHSIGKRRNEETANQEIKQIEIKQIEMHASSSSSYGDRASGQYTLEKEMASSMNLPR